MKERPAGFCQLRQVVHRAAVLLASATLISACGHAATSAAASSTTQRSSTTASAGTTASTAIKSASGSGALPPPCSLVTEAQASAALGATVTEVKPTIVGSRTGCKWVVKASSLVTGLGSNAVLDLRPPPISSRSVLYQRLESVAGLHFKPVTLDGIPAVAGFGAQNEVQADVGPTLLIVAALSTVSAAKNSTAAEQFATYALEALCQKVSCQR